MTAARFARSRRGENSLMSGGNAEAEEVGCLDNSRVVEGERTDPACLQRGSGAVEEGHIDPGRLIRRPPAQTGCTRVTLVQSARLQQRYKITQRCRRARLESPASVLRRGRRGRDRLVADH